LTNTTFCGKEIHQYRILYYKKGLSEILMSARILRQYWQVKFFKPVMQRLRAKAFIAWQKRG
jgi:hypothetical protein